MQILLGEIRQCNVANTNTHTDVAALLDIKQTLAQGIEVHSAQRPACDYLDVGGIVSRGTRSVLHLLRAVPHYNPGGMHAERIQLEACQRTRNAYVAAWSKCDHDAPDADYDVVEDLQRKLDTALAVGARMFQCTETRLLQCKSLQCVYLTARVHAQSTYRTARSDAVQDTLHEMCNMRRDMAQTDAHLQSDIDAIAVALADQQRVLDHRTARLARHTDSTRRMLDIITRERAALEDCDLAERTDPAFAAVRAATMAQLHPEHRAQVLAIVQHLQPCLRSVLETDLALRRLETRVTASLRVQIKTHEQCVQTLWDCQLWAQKYIRTLEILQATVRTNGDILDGVAQMLQSVLHSIDTVMDARLAHLHRQEVDFLSAYQQFLTLGLEHIEDTCIKQSVCRKREAEKGFKAAKARLLHAHKCGLSTQRKTHVTMDYANAKMELNEARTQQAHAKHKREHWIREHRYHDVCALVQNNCHRSMQPARISPISNEEGHNSSRRGHS